jgi:hypothetical protein
LDFPWCFPTKTQAQSVPVWAKTKTLSTAGKKLSNVGRFSKRYVYGFADTFSGNSVNCLNSEDKFCRRLRTVFRAGFQGKNVIVPRGAPRLLGGNACLKKRALISSPQPDCCAK